MLNYETNELKNWILNDEYFYNIVFGSLKDFGLFKILVYQIFVIINKKFDLINNYNFDLNELDYNKLFDYFKEY